MLRSLVAEIEQRLGRAADAGDLLLLLSSIPNGLAARALARVGVDDEHLARAVDEARREEGRSALLPRRTLLAECDRARTEKRPLSSGKTSLGPPSCVSASASYSAKR